MNTLTRGCFFSIVTVLVIDALGDRREVCPLYVAASDMIAGDDV
jgi:hypothetical protein